MKGTATSEIKSHRIQWVDIAKGIAIIFVVLFHAVPASGDLMEKFFIGRLLTSWWHQPVFFLLCGFFIREEGLQKPLTFIKGRVWRTYRMLLAVYVPAVLLHNAFIVIGWYGTQTEYSGKAVDWWGIGDFVRHLAEAIAFAGREPIMGAMWFVYVLIMALCLYAFVSKILRLCFKRHYEPARLLTIFALDATALILSDCFNITIPRFNITLTAIWWIYCGHMLREKRNVQFDSPALCMICLVFYIVTASSMTSRWPLLAHDLCMNTLSYAAALYVVCFVSRHLENKGLGKILAYCGRDSFHIMSLHFVGFKMATLTLRTIGFEKDLTALQAPAGSSLCQLLVYWSVGVIFPLLAIYLFRWTKRRANKCVISCKERYSTAPANKK